MSDARPAFVLVHGAWHNAAVWRRVMPLLEGRGGLVRAHDLPGAGVHAKRPLSYDRRPLDAAAFAAEASPNAGVTQEERTRATIALIEEAAREAGGPVILVGHSLGGLTVTAAAEAVPDLLDAVVYLAAILLPSGGSALGLLGHPSMAGTVVPTLFLAQPEAVGAFRIDPRSDAAEYRGRLREAFYGDVSEADFARSLAGLHCDEPFGVALEPSAISSARFGRVPRHYIRCLEDRALPPSGQDFMIAAVDAAIGGRTVVHSLVASHSPFYSQPRALVEILSSVADSSRVRV